MANELLTKSISGSAKKLTFMLRKHAPEILAGLGFGLVVGGTAYAVYKSVKKVAPIIDEHKAKDEDISKKLEASSEYDPDKPEEAEYTEEMAKEERHKLKVQTGLKVAKELAAPAGMVLGGLGLMAAGFKILDDRYTAMVGIAEGAVMSKRVLEKRVEEVYGKDALDKLLVDGGKMTVTDATGELDEEGKEIVTVEEIDNIVDEANLYSLEPFTKTFMDDGNPNWLPFDDKDMTLTKSMINSRISTAQDIKAIQGYYYFEDLCNEIGLNENPDNKKGIDRVAGWLKDDIIECDMIPIHYIDSFGNVHHALRLIFNCRPNILGKIEHQAFV